MTEEEIHEMLHAPRGEDLMKVIEEYEQKCVRGAQ
jgi:hypothetical protein